METLLIIVHIVVCLFLIGIVLLQHGKGADIGATFGGSSQSLFGTEGPLPLLNKITTFAAIIFMVTSVSLAYISAQSGSGSVMTEVPVEKTAVAEPVKAESKQADPENKKAITAERSEAKTTQETPETQ
ncbi:MAG: preprotein translocase subunit SecG [Proteobacteria bacterium]|nr:MAG: preprotein translocase subunit SecG [Pseudomonadota bacterium]PIE65252.1 MAG: preprotein translocase subunit SecG [Desulfobacterales bacterium]